jgi:flagellar hook-associated protein 2
MATFGSGLGIGGLASGLDSNSIIQKLVQIESLPITQLQQKKKAQQDKLSGVNRLKTLVKDLQTKAKAVSSPSNFLVFDAKASADGVASFTATGSAAAASHTLTVEQLASVDRWAFDGVDDATVNLTATAGQTVDFTANGTAYSIAVDPQSSSLENIASAINDEAGDDVVATVVNSGTASAPDFKLVLTAKASGEDARITNITSTVDDLTIDGTGPDVDGFAQSTNNITVGLNAFAIVDGLEIERSTNDFTDVIAGITFTVQAADPNKQITFSAEPNKTAIKGKVQAFVDAYNAVISYANAQNTYSPETGAGGVLFGDSLLSGVRGSIQSALFNIPLDDVINDTAGYSTLSVVGITTQRDGTLTIDQTKLDDKLAGDLTAFADLFVDTDGFDNGGAAVNTPEYHVDTSEDSGIAATLVRAIDKLVNSATVEGGGAIKGLFDTRTDTINKQMRALDDQVQRKQSQIDVYERGLIERFSRLEALIGQLQSKGQGFAAAIAGLNS